MKALRKDGANRRDALLDAALASFSEKGILDTGIEEIRKAAGASPSSVYHQFEGRNGLVVALLARTFRHLIAHLAERAVAESTAEGLVRAVVDGHLEWVDHNRREASFLYQALSLELGLAERQVLLAEKAQVWAPLFAHLETFIGRGELPSWSLHTFNIVLLGPSHEASRLMLGGAADVDMGWLRATLPGLAWASISGMR